jgi:hypothetical protein
MLAAVRRSSLNALGSRRDGMFKRGLEALIGFDSCACSS